MSTEAPREPSQTTKNTSRLPSDAWNKYADLGLAWTGTDGVVLEIGSRKIVVSPEAFRHFTKALLRGEFAQGATGRHYEAPANPNAPHIADITGMPTDEELAPALVQALGSAAGPAALAVVEATQNPIAAQPPTPFPTTGCVQ